MLMHVDDEKTEIEGFYFTDSDGDRVEVTKVSKDFFKLDWQGYSEPREIEMNRETLNKLIRALDKIGEL